MDAPSVLVKMCDSRLCAPLRTKPERPKPVHKKANARAMPSFSCVRPIFLGLAVAAVNTQIQLYMKNVTLPLRACGALLAH